MPLSCKCNITHCVTHISLHPSLRLAVHPSPSLCLSRAAPTYALLQKSTSRATDTHLPLAHTRSSVIAVLPHTIVLYSRIPPARRYRLTFPFPSSFRYQGHVSAALVLGGVDVNGPHLHTIYPHGSTDELPYVTMGSGSLAAMAVFEAKYKKDLTVRKERRKGKRKYLYVAH